MSSPSPDEESITRLSTHLRRSAARAIFCTAVVVILLDVIPPAWPWFSQPKHWLSQVLNRVGLWQGQWTMFAPDPVLENASLAAEFTYRDQKLDSWNSPDWKQVGTAEKFYRFRHLNFYNRIHLDHNRRALYDFADFLASQHSPSPIERLKIYRDSSTLLPPEDGNIRDRDNWIWISRSDFLTERRYDP